MQKYKLLKKKKFRHGHFNNITRATDANANDEKNTCNDDNDNGNFDTKTCNLLCALFLSVVVSLVRKAVLLFF